MKKTFVFLLILACLCTGLYFWRAQLAPFMPQQMAAALGVSAAEPKPDGAAKKSGIPLTTVRVAEAKAGSLPIMRQSFGYIQAKATTSLAAPVSGVVTAIAVKDGAEVKSGDLIVSFDDRALKATLAKDEAALSKDQAAYDNAKVTADRTVNLGEKGASSQQTVDNANAALEQAQAAIKVDRAQIEADKVAISNLQITAPYDGQLGAILISQGAYVPAGTPVAALVNVKDVYAQFTLAEADLKLARQALDAGKLTVEVTPTSASDGTQVLSGPITFIDNEVDQNSGTFKLWASLDNQAKAFWPGESVTARVNTGTMDNLILVPGVAVAPGQNGSLAYVVTPDNKIDIRTVTVAIRNGDTAGITKGLQAGEKVVIEGQVALSSGTAVRIDDGKAKAQDSKTTPSDDKAAAK